MALDAHHRAVMQENTARSRQYFPYAVARRIAPRFADAAGGILSAANYTRVISIAYADLRVNAWMYDFTINPFTGEDAHQVVFKGEIELGSSGVALTSRTAAQLPVNASRFVPLGTNDGQTSGVFHLLR